MNSNFNRFEKNNSFGKSNTIVELINNQEMPLIFSCNTQYHAMLAVILTFMCNRKDLHFFLFTDEKKVLSYFYNVSSHLNELGIRNTVFNKKNVLYRAIGASKIRFNIEKKRIYNSLGIANGDFLLINFAWTTRLIRYPACEFYKECKKAIFFEDGANQYVTPSDNEVVLRLKELYGNQVDFWDDNKLIKAFVQRPEKFERTSDKLFKFSLSDMVSFLSDNQKDKLLYIFMNDEDRKRIKQETQQKIGIVFTQPLSEDGFISENEKIRIYQIIVEYYSKYGVVVVKKHPRDSTDYEFDNIIQLTGDYPSELLTVMGVRFDFAVALCSSAITNVDAKRKINLNNNYLFDHELKLVELYSNSIITNMESL